MWILYLFLLVGGDDNIERWKDYQLTTYNDKEECIVAAKRVQDGMWEAYPTEKDQIWTGCVYVADEISMVPL